MPKTTNDTANLTASVTLNAAEEGQPAKFEVSAYNGGTVRIDGWKGPAIVDVASLIIPEGNVAVLRGHDHNRIVGHGTATKTDSTVTLSGVVSADNEHSREFVSAGAAGFPWQASVGLSGITPERIPYGRSTVVNGRKVNGPVTVLRNARLDEISVLPIGADRSTSISIAASAAKGKPMSKGFEAALADIEGEDERTAKLTGIADKYRERNPERVEALLAAAIDDEIDPRDFEIGLLRAVRPSGINNRPAGNGTAQLSGGVLTAALCQAAGLDANALFDEQTNQQAHDAYRGRFGIQQLLLHAANANGGNFGSFHQNPEGVVKAAFATANLSGFSTVSAANVLADVANKSLEQFFLGMDNAWRKIARIVSVRNYQPHHRPSMIADLELVPLAKDGEVQHGVLVDQDRTISVTDYARMLQLSEVDLTNDDLGALTDAARGFSYGADQALNNAFWTAFNASAASFWTSGRGNYISGATTVLSSAGLSQAHVAIGKTTVKIGTVEHKLRLDGSILLVPRALGGTARELMQSERVIGDTDRPDANIWRGRFKVVETLHLDDISAVEWYLLADPNRVATMEVAFLNGQQAPRVESAACSVESGRYGILSRAKLTFGVNRAHHQASVKSKGAA